ncbi:hypothetical protein ORIO_20765 (plasmid) [Cereibacter azotoformans]|uniref:hypothetical protein n=2 Tax=Cereibacter azotoformans TaxID=43057 RepID=UPI001F371B9E|nr:hypothetical protein [Cereibacter azotoformans]UIJ32965.1 hypothetical protein LV780_20590 [Cereibacter azotoformans]ULB12231.1 hypothetical protein ORIO_20765 [Cereibacter azotoformans]
MRLVMRQVSLLTGQLTRHHRGMVPEYSVALCTEPLVAALLGGRPALPFEDNRWLLTAHAEEQNLFATLWAGPWPQRAPILTLGVALRAREGQGLWDRLHDTPLPLQTDPVRPPRTPWIADRLEPAAMDHAHTLTWTTGFSRALAWTWFDFTRHQNDPDM